MIGGSRGRGGLVPGEFLLDRTAAGVVGVAGVPLERFGVGLQQGGVQLDVHVAGRTEAAVVGQAELFAQADVETQGHVELLR